jgi:hypothetical protein
MTTIKHPIDKDKLVSLYAYDDKILLKDPILSQMFILSDISHLTIWFNDEKFPMNPDNEEQRWEYRHTIYLDLYKLHILNRLVEKYKPS